ncbi:MAG: DUF2683 family protein [bacterium]|nr:DUF2683 family protein [bacterium]
MVQAMIQLNEHEDRVLTIVKGKYGLKTKSEAINLVIKKFEQEFLEEKLRPEYKEKLKNIEEEGYGKTFSSIGQLRKKIEKG